MKYPERFEDIWTRVKPHTMTSKSRGFALYEAVNYIIDNGIPGSFVECGVWRGGSAMIVALVLVERGVNNRQILLFDTFDGMTDPSAFDVDSSGNSAGWLLEKANADDDVVARCDLETVRSNLLSTGFVREHISYFQGDVTETLPTDRVKQIALLRLDTDFYASTAAELEHLYPLVAEGGIVIIDDYGHWQGARRAVDEFLSQEKAAGYAHFIVPLDYTGRLFVKPPKLSVMDPAETVPLGLRYDYVSPGLEDPLLLQTFTHLKEVVPRPEFWPHLRHEVPHVWRNDTRSPRDNIGTLSLDEAVLLHSAAKPFSGRRGIEIGCHFAFSTAHLIAAGLRLDVVDPMLGETRNFEAVCETLRRSTPDGEYRLHAGFSPAIIKTVHKAGGSLPWSFAFIDGLHDGDAPSNDARAITPYLAETAAVMFHDLDSPDVAAALLYFQDLGWKTRVFETMQIMGIAWRGDYDPPNHVADPAASVRKKVHLAGFNKV